ncbi:hypothetical protein ACFL6C_14150, partial [Myxococcota bacterium]
GGDAGSGDSRGDPDGGTGGGPPGGDSAPGDPGHGDTSSGDPSSGDSSGGDSPLGDPGHGDTWSGDSCSGDSSGGWHRVEPVEIDELLFNPGIGWMTHGQPAISNTHIPPGIESTVHYKRIAWQDIHLGDGQYDWTPIDNQIGRGKAVNSTCFGSCRPIPARARRQVAHNGCGMPGFLDLCTNTAARETSCGFQIWTTRVSRNRWKT